MGSKITFYIVRHGKTQMNTQDKVQGWSDSPLTLEGIEAAGYVGLGMKDIPFRSAYCSTLNRTKQTAETILEAKGQSDIKVVEEAGFKEAGFGSFESQNIFEMWESVAHHLRFASSQQMYEAILEGKITYREIMNSIKTLDQTGTAENYEEVEIRSQEALRRIAAEEALEGKGNILIVAHGISILAMLMSLGADKISKSYIENAAVCKVTYQDGKFHVESMNDLSFMQQGRLELL